MLAEKVAAARAARDTTNLARNLLAEDISIPALFTVMSTALAQPAAGPAWAKEATEVWAPLGHRLGLAGWTARVEDIAFHIQSPPEYSATAAAVAARIPDPVGTLNSFTNQVRGLAEANRVTAALLGRVKHLYSVWRKETLRGVPLSDMTDLIGLRLVVNTTDDLYRALTMIESNFQSSGRERHDYVLAPKSSGYRSVHTVVLTGGVPVEVQVRTWAMHAQAQLGSAAHWWYKSGGSGVCGQRERVPAGTREIAWMAELMARGVAVDDRPRFLSNIRASLGGSGHTAAAQ